MPNSAHPADRYGETFAKLTPDTLDQLCAMVSDQVYFSDPFNQITGKVGFRAFATIQLLILQILHTQNRPVTCDGE